MKRAALIASFPGDEISVAAALSACPGRFYGYFMLNPLQDDAAARARSAFAAGLHAVCLFPAMHRYAVNDPRVRPVFEEATTAHAAVFVHSGVLTVGVRSKLGLPSPFDMRYSNPIDLHPVAIGYPEVRFLIPHFGAGYLREALMLADLCPNVYLDTSSSNAWMRYEGIDLKAVYRTGYWRHRRPAGFCSAPTPRSSRAAGILRSSNGRRWPWRTLASAPRMPA